MTDKNEMEDIIFEKWADENIIATRTNGSRAFRLSGTYVGRVDFLKLYNYIKIIHEKELAQVKAENEKLKALVREIELRFETCNYTAGFFFDWHEKAKEVVG